MSRPVIITAIIFVVALLLGFTLVWPKYQNLRGLKEEIRQKEVELSSKTEYYSRIRDITAEFEQYQEGLSKIASALPPDPSLPSLFHFLSQTASQSGLILEDITLGSVTKVEKLKEINVDLQLSGSYSSLKNFLSALEKSARLIKIRKVSFSSPEKSKEPFIFDISIATHSY